MAKYTRLFAPLTMGTMLVLGACKADTSKQDTTNALNKDTTALGRDLAMAGRDTTAQPQLKDVPANAPATSGRSRTEPRSPRSGESRETAPRETAPRTTPSGNVVTHPSAGSNSGGAVGTIAAGTTLSLTPTQTVCTNTNKVGDKITATTQNAVTGTNGATIPAGATVTLTVTNLKRSDNARDPIVMEFAVNSVTFNGKTYPLDASLENVPVTKVRNEPKSKDAHKVAIGAAVGAIAGQILGKNTKSTVIGGAVGAAAGGAAAVATANYEGCIQNTSTMTVKLNSPAQVRVAM
jgi:hypothetical protein